jgi:peptidoglycan LD-endopeptidase LytH
MAGKFKPVCFGSIAILAIALLYSSCSNNGVGSLFKKQPPHDAYAQKLRDAGLDKSALGSKWLLTATEALTSAVNVTLPYRETGYFPADKASAAAFQFQAKRGRKISISIEQKPVTNYRIYADLFELKDGKTDHLTSADSLNAPLTFEVKRDGRFVLRLQPELLQSGQYTVTITTNPALDFPVAALGKPYIGSVYGDTRDAGIRSHEGIDIFAPKLTPALAAANGTVSRVTTNNLGGKVVFFRPQGADYTLYYAHLDSQLVSDGQVLKAGDSIGLVGNTGNARTTPSHLHFGIYTSGGAINPLAFVEKDNREPAKITAPLERLNATMRVTGAKQLFTTPNADDAPIAGLATNTAVTVTGATGNWYKAELPDGQQAYVKSANTKPLSTLRSLTLKADSPLLDAPDSLNAPAIKMLSRGFKVNIQAVYKDYYLVNHDGTNGWIAM